MQKHHLAFGLETKNRGKARGTMRHSSVSVPGNHSAVLFGKQPVRREWSMTMLITKHWNLSFGDKKKKNLDTDLWQVGELMKPRFSRHSTACHTMMNLALVRA